MIVGQVDDLEARVRVAIVGPKGSRLVEAVVDTGYNGWLTLPTKAISALGLAWHSYGEGELADGRLCEFQVFTARVKWEGQERPIFVDEAEAVPMIGMSLLLGHELRIKVRPRGRVEIRRFGRHS